MKPIQVIFYTLLTLFVLAVISIGGLYLLIQAFSDTTPSIKGNSTLIISISGTIPEYVPKSSFPLQSDRIVSIKSTLDNIEKAKVDRRIKGILLRINMNFMGWAKIDEIKQKLDDFKESGKYVVAYLGSYASEKDYYLSLSADSIYAVPGGLLEMNGLAIQTVHTPGLLEKLGISLEYVAFGKYKSHSGESYGRKKHTEPVLEMLNSLLDWEYDHLVSAIAKRVNISNKEVKSVFDLGYIDVDKFVELGWVDDMLYEDQLLDKLKKMNINSSQGSLNYISSLTYEDISKESLGLNKGKDRIALIYSQGVIQEGDGDFSPLSLEMSAGTNPMIKAIKRAANSKRVKAIIYRVDSPGGSGLGCDLVWREILKAKQKKPVIASMSDYAASGGYWISMGATAIVAQPSTITGSIGVWGIFPNLGGLYDKLGLVEENVKRGKHADMLLGSKEMSPYEKKIYRDHIYKVYTDFVSKAAESRGVAYSELEPYAQGRSWTGEQAKENGLIDELGGLDKAIELAREKAELDSTQKTKVVVYSSQKSWFEKLMSDGFVAQTIKIIKHGGLKHSWETILNTKKVYIWPMLPYQFKIN